MIYWIPSVFVALAIIGVSHQSSLPSAVQLVPGYTLHASAYFILGLTLVFGQTRGFRAALSRKAVAVLWLGAVLFAISDEFHQSFVVNRTAQISDLISDALGALAAIVGYWLFWRNGKRVGRGGSTGLQEKA